MSNQRAGSVYNMQAGNFDQHCFFYVPVQTQDAAGGEVRTPRAADLGDASPVYAAWAEVNPYQGMIVQDAERQTPEEWMTISIRYHRSRVPTEGMLIKIELTGEVLEIRGAMNVNFARKKVDLTCRLLK